ncbi:Phenol hydroxylase P5 protein [Corynebacterium ciconiae DSM 44920]|uniref:FAD-binding oxidoreductase n=1 Tax=Corynebacterium ciconiae TaxID=227319 RepID=UPI0003618DF4|nr:FAD-binding oxidoreductase [Corynebacterium ciconiae]WKD62056.1 Phenol hydroxylase P5 protein [Corynebacterium ciconiae DSM 44920]
MATEDLSDIAERLLSREEAFRTMTYERLIASLPDIAILFSSSPEQRHHYFVPMLGHLLRNTPTSGTLTPRMHRIVAQLGRDHRKFRVPVHTLPEFGRIINRGIIENCADMSVGHVLGAQEAVSSACDIMASAMITEEHRGIPALYRAEVVEVERRTKRVSVVRVVTDRPIPYRAGQFLPCNANLIPGEWRFLSPANPTNAQGLIEFHIRIKQGGRCSPMFGLARPGDVWWIGNPLGTLAIPGDRDVLMLAHTHGLALLRSMIFDLAEQQMRVHSDAVLGAGDTSTATTVHTPPNVTLFYGAEFPAELYDLSTLMQLSATHSWLRVYPCVDSPTNPYWAHDSNYSRLPTGLNLNIGSPTEVAMRTTPPVHASSGSTLGAWRNHDIFIHGGGDFILPARERLYDAGIDAARIHTIPLG